MLNGTSVQLESISCGVYQEVKLEEEESGCRLQEIASVRRELCESESNEPKSRDLNAQSGDFVFGLHTHTLWVCACVCACESGFVGTFV